MRRVIGIGGEPATGKSSLVVKLLGILQRGPSHVGRWGVSIRGISFPEKKLLVLGVYDGSTFQGTDRLSMAVQPEVERMLTDLTWSGWTLLFEGDRLFRPSFLRASEASGAECHWFLLVARGLELMGRHLDRADSQRESFLKAQRTKLRNIAQEFHVKQLPNNDGAQQGEAINELMRLIRRR